MTPVFHFDIGTQYAAAAVLCFTFGATLFMVALRFPHIRGAFRLSEGFLVATLGIVAFLMRGRMPLSLSVLLANGLMWLSYLFLYTGVASLLNIRPRRIFPACIALAAFVIIGYFVAVNPQIATRIIVISIADCLIQMNLFVDLLRTKRPTIVIKLGTFLVGIFIAANVLRAIAIAVHGATGNIFEYDPVQAVYTFCGVLGACSLGTFCMALIGWQITSGIEQDARRDSLTGAFNRLGIEELMLEELDRSRQNSVPLVIALLDIDHFKTFNDCGGHAAGDDVLRRVVEAIKRHLRPADSCGRMGGDEFLLLFPESSEFQVSAICDRIRREIAALPAQGLVVRSPTVSLGIARADATNSRSELLARADRSLYAAKQAGRNCARISSFARTTIQAENPAVSEETARLYLRRSLSSM